VSQILTNLVDNAYNYTPPGGHISITLIELGGEVRVSVSDDGIGISPEEQERVFERFYRGEDPLVLATAGTGLGLSIVRQLVEMHGGRIWLESSGVPGEGSTFSFSLPVYTVGSEHSREAEFLPEVTV
jgi:signal transduction histidine kinase